MSHINDLEHLSELPAFSNNTNATYWVPPRTLLPEWIPYQILPQNVQVLLKKAASQLPEDNKALLLLQKKYAQVKLAVEEANLDANIENEKRLDEYRVELSGWRKKWAAVHQMQLQLLDVLMAQILELMQLC